MTGGSARSLAQTPIVVLGMHRSGTSALTRALGLMGVSLGPAEGLDHHWEQERLWRFDNDLLRAVGGEWDTPPRLAPGWTTLDAVRALEPHARSIVEELSAAPPWVIKDPRLCLTLPFWHERVGLEPMVIFIHRNPVEIVASLQRRNPEKRLYGSRVLALWERYNCDALANARPFRTLYLSYNALVDDPVAACERVRAALEEWGVPGLGSAAAAASELDTGERHHVVGHTATLEIEGRTVRAHMTAAQQDLLRVLDGLELGRVPDPNALPRVSQSAADTLELWRQIRFLVRSARVGSRAARAIGGLGPRLSRDWLRASRGPEGS
jgi:hypothetical protein